MRILGRQPHPCPTGTHLRHPTKASTALNKDMDEALTIAEFPVCCFPVLAPHQSPEELLKQPNLDPSPHKLNPHTWNGAQHRGFLPALLDPSVHQG